MFQQKRIIRYVMGEMDEAEQLRIEEQYFADAKFLGKVQAVCEELIDAYLTGTMAVSDRERFEKRLHAVPFLREQVETSRALMHRTAINAGVERQAASAQLAARTSWNAMLKALVPRLAITGAVCGLLLAGAWYWWSGRVSPSRPSQPSEQIAATATATPLATILPTAPAAPSAAARPSRSVAQSPTLSPIIASILLSTEATRSEKQVAHLVVPSSQGVVRLQLELPLDKLQPYQAVLQTAQGKPLQSWRKVMPVRHGTAAVIDLQAPAQLLSEGEYQVSVSQGAIPRYQFRFAVQPE